MQNPINIDLGLLCQVVGRRVGVEVIEDPHAHTFATNGKSVIIPKGIAGGELDADIMRGGIAHEAAGHVLHTDFDLLNQWVRKQPPIAHGLQNIIEDPRIELAAIRKYPGCRKMLHKMVETLESRGFFTLPDASSHPSAILGAYLIRALRSELLNQPLSMEVIAPLAEETFGKQKLETMLGLARRGAKGESTADVLRATEAILSILKDEEPPEDEAPDEGDESGEQDGEQSGGGNASQSGDDAGGDDEAAGNCAGKDGKGKAGGNADSNQAPSEQPGANSSSAAQQEAAKKAMDANKSDMGPTDLGEIIGKATEGMGGGRGRSGRKPARRNMRQPAAYQSSKLATCLTTRLRSSLEQLLQSRVDDEDPDREEFGRLDPRMMTRAKLGDRRIFTTDGDEAEGLSTAVHVLVDCSGSMVDFDKAGAAQAVIYALSSAMAPYETQGVKFALTAFNSDLVELKGFSDPWVKAKSWIGNYRAGGGTEMNEAIRAVLPELAARRETRKTLVVITDGDVGDAALNQQVNRFAKSESVEVDVLVIGTDRVANNHGFRSVAQAPSHDAQSIQSAIFKMLKRAV